MKMNKEDMANMENETSEGDVGKATPAHEAAESGTKEHKEDVAQDSSESDGEGEEDMGEMMGMSQADCDAHDLLRAAEVKMDEARYSAAMDILKKKKAAIESMDDLMAVRKSKMLEKKA